MNKPKAIFCWSGGKDSAYCLHKVLSERLYEVCYLLTTIVQKENHIQHRRESLQTDRGENRPCLRFIIKHERILVLRFNSGIKNI